MALIKKQYLPACLFAVAITVYLVVRLIALEQFPIYFFSDEAVQSVRAADFLRDGLRNESGELLPPFFKNAYQYNLGVSVYLQTLPVLLFGKHIFLTRAVSVMVSMLAALAAGLAFEMVFKRGAGWLAILLLSLMPAWFLHTRTAFETVLAVSFYSAFWLCYLLYRERDPRFLYPAVALAALAFYSYSPAQVVVSLTILAFFLNDLRYHWQHRRTVLSALMIGLLFLIPYARFVRLHPGEVQNHLQIVASVWVTDLSFAQKITTLTTEYLRAFNPFYWFIPGAIDLPRHIMKGYGHLWQPSLPLILIGLGICLINLRTSRYRLIIIALLCAPTGAAIAQLGITRELFMVLPATLLAALGAVTLFGWLRSWKPFRRLEGFAAQTLLSLVMLISLSAANVAMLIDSLKNGPTWFHDYGLYGMQYGAREVFSQIRADLEADPTAKLVLTPGWANGTDILARFFFEDPQPFELASIDRYIRAYHPLDENTVLIMMPNELDDMLVSDKFDPVEIEKTIAYPDGRPGFYFVRLAYRPDIQQIFAAEQETRRNLISADLHMQDGSPVALHYSTLDMGDIANLFDGDPLSVTHTWESNPFQLIFDFPQARKVDQVLLRIGGEPTRIELELFTDMNSPPQQLAFSIQEKPSPRDVLLNLNLQQALIKASIRVYNLNEQEPAHVHLWEVRFLPDQE